jgi:hypothetical protein
LRAEFSREFGDQGRPLDRGGVHGDFVRAGPDYRACIVQSANATTRGEWNGQFGSDAADRLEEGGPAIARGGDIQDDQFVGAFGVVASSLRHGIAGVAQANEVHAFDDAGTIGIEAGNDPVGEGHAASLRKFWSSCAPAAPLFSG